MNADLSIHRMAFREADTLGVAQLLIARKRQELELRMLREQVAGGEESAQTLLDTALQKMDEDSATLVRDLAPGNAEQHVDKRV